MSRNYCTKESIVSLCSIYQTIAFIRDLTIALQWGKSYASLFLFLFIKKFLKIATLLSFSSTKIRINLTSDIYINHFFVILQRLTSLLLAVTTLPVQVSQLLPVCGTQSPLLHYEYF